MNKYKKMFAIDSDHNADWYEYYCFLKSNSLYKYIWLIKYAFCLV